MGAPPPENIVTVKNLEKKGITVPVPVCNDKINLNGKKEQKHVQHHQIFGREAAAVVHCMDYQGD
jgi:hypothetical protein